MIDTVHKNFESYAKKEIEKAELFYTVQNIIGQRPSNKYYKHIVSQNDLKSCQINVGDVKNTKAMLELYCPSFKGWST